MFTLYPKFYRLIFTTLLGVGTLQCVAVIHTIKVKRNSFEPKLVSAIAGDTIRWVWEAGTHNLIGNAAHNGTVWHTTVSHSSKISEKVFSTPGDFTYLCSKHSLNVIGTITVGNPLIAEVKSPATAAKTNTDSSSLSVKIYPQPFKNNLTVDLGNVFKKEVRIEIFDALGELKFSKNTTEEMQEPLTMNLSSLAPGYYLININDGLVKKTFRVLKAE